MRIAVCDDDDYFREEIVKAICEMDNQITLEVFTTGKYLLDKVNEKYDLIILDIEMEPIDGIEVATRFRNNNNDSNIMFVTSHTEFISDAFRHKAFQYISKPLDKKLFYKEIHRAMEESKQQRANLYYTWQGKPSSVPISEIYYIETCRRNLSIATKNEAYKSLGNLNTMEKRLAGFFFVRCHNSYLVNMKHIDDIGASEFIMRNDAVIPISRNLYRSVKSKYMKYLMDSSR